MIISRIKSFMLVFLLLPLLFLTLNCGSSKQVLPRNIYLGPDADFSKYKRQGIFLDLDQVPKGRKELNFYIEFKQELEKLGYDVLGGREFFSFLKIKGFSIEDISDPQVLSDIRHELKISAVMKITVTKYEFEEKEQRVERIHKLEPLTLEPHVDRIYHVPEFIVDFSFVLDMIEMEQGQRVWSCSISCEKEKVEENRYDLIRKMIKKCLKAIPKK